MDSKLRDEGDPRILRAEARSNQEIARRLEEAPAPQEEEKGMGSDDLPQPQGEPTRLFPRHGPLKGSPSDVKEVRSESDVQRRPDGGYDNIVEPQPENQPRRRTGMDPDNDDSFALFPEDDNEDMEVISLIQSGMPEQVAKDYINIYEVLLVQGASKGVAKQKSPNCLALPGSRRR